MSSPSEMIPLNLFLGDDQRGLSQVQNPTEPMPDVEDLRILLRNDFCSAWNLNDHAHREEHFMEVEKTALEICRRLNYVFDHQMILLAAYFHDLFAWSRYNHHTLSATWVRTTDYPIIANLDHVSRELVAQGCEYHRSSGVGEFPSAFAELICSADRGLPSDIARQVARAMQTRYFKDPYMDRHECLVGALEHLRQKYGSNGYARIPGMYHAAFSKEVEKREHVFNVAKPHQVDGMWHLMVDDEVILIDLS